MENLENKVERAEPGWDEFVQEHEKKIYDAKGKVPWIKAYLSSSRDCR